MDWVRGVPIPAGESPGGRRRGPKKKLLLLGALVVSIVLLVGALVLRPVLAAGPEGNAVDAGQATCTTDHEGYCDIPHRLRRKPAAVVVNPITPSAGRLAVQELTEQSFRLRALTNSGSAYTGELTVSYVAYADGSQVPTTSPTPSTSATSTQSSPPSPSSSPSPSKSRGTTSATRTSAPASGGGPLSGLPWLSGVHTSNEAGPFFAFGQWRGRPIDVAVVFPERNSGWGPLVRPDYITSQFTDFPGKLILSQPTYPEGQGNNAACAGGAYDDQWKKFGTFLVQAKRADSIVRIGWEFNGDFMYWHADADPAAFAACYRKVAAAIRSTDPKVLLDWTINAHASPEPASGNPFDAYPGDQYVDYTSIDAYDHFPPSKTEADWNAQCDDVNGLCHMIDFAKQHGKKVGVGEWGVTSCGGGNGGDNSLYIKKMHDAFVAAGSTMGYEAYYHDASPGNVCSTIQNGGQNPQSSAVYKKLFGKV
jgi:hypothetical protein